jgi:iron complex outermembrane recepter protein
MTSRLLLLAGLFSATELLAQAPPAPSSTRDSARTLKAVRVTVDAEDRVRVNPVQFQTLPVTASVTATQARTTVNLIDTQDAVKYLPSVFLRKRNNGDTQATMATRVWGVGSSARSLIFADGVLLSALIANNNNIGGPRWGLVSPAEISRIDMMYGPYSAAYAGNSMGAVMEITTRMPTRLEGSVEQSQAMQRFGLYGTLRTYPTAQTNASIGNRFGRFAFWLSGNYQNSQSQPISYVTAATNPAGTDGAFTAFNRVGAPANVLGAGGLLRTEMTNAKAKLTYDLTPGVRLAYAYGFWQNDAAANVESYLSRTGQSTFAGVSGFASNYYTLMQRHTSQSVSLRSDRKKDWDIELVGTRYAFDKDQQRVPLTASATGVDFGAPGRVAVLDGTGWTTADAKAVWHAGGRGGAHTVSFGAHYDEYTLRNPTYTTTEWTSGAFTGTATEGRGSTRTRAAWMQDKWRLSDAFAVTFGGRFEQWRAFGGFNQNGATRVSQPEVRDEWFSPKLVVAWTPSAAWSVTASTAKAVRFATAAELYQLVSTGVTFTSPAPDLRPDNVFASELRVSRSMARGTLQLALFQDDVRDAIISQFLPLVPNSTTLYSYLSNVDRVRARGVEFVFGAKDVVLRGLELSGSTTYLDARTLALSGRASSTAPAGSAIGKRLPNIPEWRATVSSTYRATDRVALTVAGRYSSQLYATLDNSDVNTNTWQGFGEWFVADARANVRLTSHWSAGLGVDNLLNRKYFLFHPFPQRTLVGNARFVF